MIVKVLTKDLNKDDIIFDINPEGAHSTPVCFKVIGNLNLLTTEIISEYKGKYIPRGGNVDNLHILFSKDNNNMWYKFIKQ